MPRILTFNVGDFWPANARASVVAAAKRWGCEIIEIASTLGAPDILAAKFRAAQFCGYNDRAMLLDADIVIRDDCPSPFDAVPPDHLGAVCNFQGDTHDGDHERYQRPSWDIACGALGVLRPYSAAEYINGGLIVFSKEHEPMFDMLARRISNTSGVNEQGAFSVAMAEMPTVYLPREWNRVGPAVWESSPQMSAMVYHFANYFDWRGPLKAERIKRIQWQTNARNN